VSRSDTPPAVSRVRNPYEGLDLDRAEGITTTRCVLPQGARHGGGGKFVLADTDRDGDGVTSKFDLGDDGRRIPNGSVYQHARAAWYAHEDDFVTNPNTGRDYAVLTRSYEHPAEDEDDEYAVTLRSSPWKAGTGTGDDYSPWYSYDLTVQPMDDDGSIAWKRTPPRSLSLKLEPQDDALVYPDGNDFRLPHGEGTLVRVQSTWVDQTEEFLERAAHLLGHTLNYGVLQEDVVTESAAFEKAEVHHRLDEAVEGDVVHTLRQSAELLAKHDADVDDTGKHEGSRWLEQKIRTSEWEQLGFPRLDAEILIKLYYPKDPDRVDYPLDQPKLEVALNGKETVVDEETGQRSEKMIPWERWDEVMAILDEILLSHLQWADVSEADLVADDYSDGPENPRVQWFHPEGRRYWLRKHYESLQPALYREATRTRTDLVLDILDIVRRRGQVTYEDLVAETGAAKRTVREHVRRLADGVGGDDAPGLLSRTRGAKTLVAFSSRYLEDLGADAIDAIQADREELAEDRGDRADDRVHDHLTDLGLSSDDADTLVEAVREDSVYTRDDLRDADEPDDLEGIVDDLGLDVDLATSSDEDSDSRADEPDADDVANWEAFGDLPIGAQALAYALDEDAIDGDHVRVRTDPYPRLTD